MNVEFEYLIIGFLSGFVAGLGYAVIRLELIFRKHKVREWLKRSSKD